MNSAQDEVAITMCLDFDMAPLKKESQLLDFLLIVIEALIREDPSSTVAAQCLQKMMGRQVHRRIGPCGQLALVLKLCLWAVCPRHVAPRSRLAMERAVAQFARLGFYMTQISRQVLQQPPHSKAEASPDRREKLG
jgi:hypothetical protein